jgi:Calcineurin-like phosphoesterase
MSCITATSVPPVRCPLASRLALALVLTALAPIARAEPLHAWVELVGRGGAPSVRVITADATCPPLRADGEEVAMQVRAGPQPLFQGDSKGSKPPTARFPVTVCEATLKRGTARAVLDGNQPLPLPPAVINRIVVLGDTGCRLSKKERQDCDPKGWPYADLARRAADAAPDLVIHVGDYLYRESCTGAACPTTGYGWDVWQADFFTPSKPLFAAAPWIMARGNHEICARAGEGWFRFLDGPRPGAKCPDMSDPFVVDLGHIGFVVIDSSAVPKDEYGTGTKPVADRQKLRAGYDAVATAIPTNAWLVTHVPFNGIVRDKKGGGTVENTILQKALGDRLKPGIKMIVSGHIHLFEALSFFDDRPPQLVVGSGGTDLSRPPTGTRNVPRIKGLPVDRKASVILQHFGFMLWERDAAERTAWNGKLIGQAGNSLVSCRLRDRALACQIER